MTLNPLDETVLGTLRAKLPDGVFRAPSEHYLTDQRGLTCGKAGAVLAPQTPEQVSLIIKIANHARIPVVPFGGGTGLAGGALMSKGPTPLIISLERLNKIRDVCPISNVITAEAGVILQNLQGAASDVNRLFPLSLASQGSCQIGGNLATNAGGVNVLRYGNARDLCLGLEAVLPNGEIWHGLKRLRKDNTGYDLKNLLIGAEGTLGIITAATLRLFMIPPRQGAALMVVNSPADALSLLDITRRIAGDGITAFELISGTGLAFLAQTMPQIRQPFLHPPTWSVLIDLGLFADQNPQDTLAKIYEQADKQALVSDGHVAQNDAQRQSFWTVRESIPIANKSIGSLSSHDISLPIDMIDKFINDAGQHIEKLGDFRINCFGHLGDGNLHYNIFPAPERHKFDYPNMPEKIKKLVYDLVAKYDGSFSAEHGIGRLKTAELQRYGDPTKISAMSGIKAALDPNGIMNPGAVLPFFFS